MKTPLVVLIAIVVCILGFLVVYSQQHDVTTASATQVAAGGYGSHGAAPAAGGYGAGSKPAAGGYGAAPAASAGGYGAAPAAASGGYGAPAPKPAAASGGYGAPAAGGYGK